mmetsp:Transcript_35593/g.118988  ORF Transcript_35593/g.118988 Transcript_35593/m.118988 type:complete len:158 (-) Transcript_35593:344-817(-)
MLRAAHGLISGRLGSTSRNLGSTSGGVGVAEVFPRVRCAGGAVDRSACLRPVAVGLPPPRRAAPAPLPLTLTLGAWDGGYEEGSFDAVVSSYVFDALHVRSQPGAGWGADPRAAHAPRSCPTLRGRSAECARCWRRAESGSTWGRCTGTTRPRGCCG